MGRRDKIRAGIIQPHDHEHEYRLVESDPIIEDGAAIFRKECIYAEGEYGQGWECEESLTYRFEYSHLESPTGETWDLPDITEWDDNDLPEKHAEKVIVMEERFHMDKAQITGVDPDPDCGQVTIEYCGWKVHFEP